MAKLGQIVKLYKLKRYLKKIRYLIPAKYKNKENIINDIRQNIDLYLLEFPNSSFEDIQKEFGTPMEVVAAVLNEFPDTYVVNTINEKKSKLLILSFISIIIITLLVIRIYNIQIHKAVYIEDTVLIYEETVIKE